MAREKLDFRDNLERLSERFPNREIIPLREVSAYLGCDSRMLLRDPAFPRRALGDQRKTYYVPLVGLARWLSC